MDEKNILYAEVNKNNKNEINYKEKTTYNLFIMLSTHFLEEATRYEMGIDEVGRGPMFGRVYASAVILPLDKECDTEKKDDDSNSDNDRFKYEWMKDSKKFTSSKKLGEVAKYIMDNAVAWGVAYKDEMIIDEMNILKATQCAMKDAIYSALVQFREKYPLSETDFSSLYATPHLLVDGNSFKPIVNPDTKNTLMDYSTVIGGDNKYCSIAAASILAKWHRDQYIFQMCEEWPMLNERYQLVSNKGYGTKAHMEAINKYGISQWHRRTFGICARVSVNVITKEENIAETETGADNDNEK